VERKYTLFEIIGIVALQHASFGLRMEMDTCVRLFSGYAFIGLDEQNSLTA
jgi:hypothetical protein